jgi:hypothetical protein
MKRLKLFRLLGIIAILSIILAVIPAAPVLAVETLTLQQTQVKIGDRVYFSGTGYIASDNEYYIDVYITDQAISTSYVIDNQITRYKRVVWGNPLETDGTYSGSFILPTTLNEGTTGEATPLTLAEGSSYAVFTTGIYSNPTSRPTSIKAYAALTITAGATLDPLSPATGQAGTQVTISGANFPASTALVIKFDTTTLTPTAGSTQTGSGGSFTSIVTIPSATAGTYNITVTAGSSTKTATFTVIASPTLNPLSPELGAAGSSVTVSGTGFPPSNLVIIRFDTTVISSSTATDTSGAFSATATIPSSASGGTHNISVSVSTVTKNKTFNVTAPATTTPPTTTPPATTPPTTTPPTTTPPPTSKTSLNVVQNGNFIGATMGIGGAGFTPGANVTIKFDNIVVGTAKVDANTTFISPFFEVPSSQHGDHVITVTDGVNTSTTTFTVESTAPKVPQPLKPALGAKVKSPVVFDWQEVTDESKPVTYRLQVATDKSFGTASVVLDRSDIEGSSYTLSEIEELKLAAQDTAYYWRIKSVDAAANESEWTGAGEFNISGPFKLPTWGIYTSIAVGAVVFFLIGLWVGRRTAFYY